MPLKSNFPSDSMAYVDRLSSEPKVENDSRNPVETTPYGIIYLNAERVPDANAGSMKVCIIDSGYDLSHPDLPSDTTTPLVTGESFVPGYDWSSDENSHGTHVAGTISAIGENGIGVKGVIRNGSMKLHIAKVFDENGSATWSSIIAAFESCVANGSNVINMSFSGSFPYYSFQDAITDAYVKHNILMFASSGNSAPTDGSVEYNYPASYEYVTSVASVNSSYKHSYF